MREQFGRTQFVAHRCWHTVHHGPPDNDRIKNGVSVAGAAVTTAAAAAADTTATIVVIVHSDNVLLALRPSSTFQ